MANPTFKHFYVWPSSYQPDLLANGQGANTEICLWKHLREIFPTPLVWLCVLTPPPSFEETLLPNSSQRMCYLKCYTYGSLTSCRKIHSRNAALFTPCLVLFRRAPFPLGASEKIRCRRVERNSLFCEPGGRSERHLAVYP